MKYIISIFLYIIGSISFLLLGVSVITCSYLFKPRQYDRFAKLACRLFLKSFFIDVRILGAEKLDREKTYIFMANHVNIFDVFVLYGYIPNFARGVELDAHFAWPVWGPVIRRFGNIPISQTNTRSAIKSLSLAENAIRSGTSIIILPEGHRTKNDQLLPFMKGPFILSLNAKSDIVPTAMVGAFQIKRVTHWLVQPGQMKFVFGDVIPYAFYKDKTPAELRDFVKNKIQNLIDTHR
ncbi:MAG: lysophospholipid acyltransferase family protein [Candidatus Zhuqueibacterota bacterium]